MKKTTVFLSGATGNMGWRGFQELLKKKDRFNLRLLVRPSRKNRRKLAPWLNDPDVTVIWGDLTCLEDVKKGVAGSDYVLHVGGMVSPAADYYPSQTLRTNVLSAQNVAAAVLAQPNAEQIKVVYIGSVAQYGQRSEDLLWGRCGDPERASLFDAYSVSKCAAEKAIVDSGLKHWVSLRQSGILYAGILKAVSPTAFHVPVKGALEWTTVEDSGVLLANVVEPSVPEEFWNRFYNISSGEQYRMTNYEFESRLLKSLGLPGPEKVFRPEWFALRNFHGMWYTDADNLDSYLHFRANIPVDEYFKSLKKSLPWYYRLAPLAPAWAIKLFMKLYAYKKGLGTQWWVKHDPQRIGACYGSMEDYKAIHSWDQMRPAPLEKNLRKAEALGFVHLLDHGYDESRSIYSLTDEEIAKAAEFRGGRFLGSVIPSGSETPSASDADSGALRRPGTLYDWECEHAHRFSASLEYVLLGGGWCPQCGYQVNEPYPATRNRFLKQVLR